jgi:hypothetical protein
MTRWGRITKQVVEKMGDKELSLIMREINTEAGELQYYSKEVERRNYSLYKMVDREMDRRRVKV